VKIVLNPADEKYKMLAKKQDADRKDMERAVGVLQSRWVIVRYPAKTWSLERMWNVITSYAQYNC
jgi:hypothetical protein